MVQQTEYEELTFQRQKLPNKYLASLVIKSNRYSLILQTINTKKKMDSFNVHNGEFYFSIESSIVQTTGNTFINNFESELSLEDSIAEVCEEKEKKRSNQNSNRQMLRKIEKIISKLGLAEAPYKIQQFGRQDRRQIFAILRYAHDHNILHEFKQEIFSKYSSSIEKLGQGKIDVNSREYKVTHLAIFINDLEPIDFLEESLQQTLYSLFKCGQVKKYKPNKNWLVEKYLSYQEQIFNKLL